jgi:hypothetical protein
MKLSALLLLTASLTFISGSGRCEETTLLFQGAAYPLKITVSPETPVGAVIYETPLSRAPLADYDTVLVEGMMPDPRIKLQVRMKNGSVFKTYERSVIHRFPNGRFWVKYKLGALTREPLKITVLNNGVGKKHILTIYGAEIFSEAAEKESASLEITPDYQPGPELSALKELSFPMVRRAVWKAAAPKKPYAQHTPKLFTLHHTEGHSPADYEAALQEMRFLQDYHQNGKGWIDIAYHFLVSPQGDIFEGRPIGVVGAHVANKNANNTGISVMGNYFNQEPGRKVLDAVAEIGRYMKATYKIGAGNFYAHRDIGSSDCPGDNLYAKMPELKNLIFKSSVPGPVRDVYVSASFGEFSGEAVPSLTQLLGYGVGGQ